MVDVMNYYALTDHAIAKELGARVKHLRLQKNITQQELAASAELSLKVVKALEAGTAKLLTIIAVLRELGALDELSNFIPEISISPLKLAKMQGKERQRATGGRGGKKS